MLLLLRLLLRLLLSFLLGVAGLAGLATRGDFGRRGDCEPDLAEAAVLR